MNILADANPTADQIKDVVVYLFLALSSLATVGLYLQGRRKKHTEISPQPFAVEIVKAVHEQFAAKVDFEKHIADNTKRHAQIFEKIEQVKEQTTKEVRGLSEKIVALQTETGLQSKQLGKLDAMEKEISAMPGKVVANIVNAQNIGRIK